MQKPSYLSTSVGKNMQKPHSGLKTLCLSSFLSLEETYLKTSVSVVFCVIKNASRQPSELLSDLRRGDPYKTRSSVLWKKRHQRTLKKPQSVKRFLPMAWFRRYLPNGIIPLKEKGSLKDSRSLGPRSQPGPRRWLAGQPRATQSGYTSYDAEMVDLDLPGRS